MVWYCIPDVTSAMFYFYSNELGFSPKFLGLKSLYEACAKVRATPAAVGGRCMILV